jgi:toxin ParE1/3/4
MSLKLRFLPGVEGDVLNAYAWYEAKSIGLGEDFLKTFYGASEGLTDNPELYPIVHVKIRRRLLPRFPYATYFRINIDEIVVFGVFHCARDPGTIGKILKSRDG